MRIPQPGSRCTACDHPVEVHEGDGCRAFVRGDDVNRPKPCTCTTTRGQVTYDLLLRAV